MALQIRNSKELIQPDKFKMKALCFGLPGSGKTQWASTAPNPLFVACETGQGKGLLTVASKGLAFIEPTSLADLEAVCTGQVGKEFDTIIIDSLSEMVKTFVKDAALAIPRTRGESDKRRKGVPELDDYGVMGEITRRNINRLLSLDKHIIVTATMRVDKPDAETGQGVMLIGPDLPGQMFLGSTAMFDFVFHLRTRQMLADPKDAKSRYTQRYLQTQQDGVNLCKCRSAENGVALLDNEEIINLQTGAGTIPKLLEKIVKRYIELAAK